jgi:hypothetical protein
MKALVIALLVACSGPAAKQGPATVAPADVKRCLPVVAKECDCVYSCGVGEQRGDHWLVRRAYWKDAGKAQIESWCSHGECTDAFAAEIICDGICMPKAADPTCHFDASGACIGRS